MTIASLIVDVQANTARLVTDVEQVHGKFDSLASTARTVATALAGAFSVAAIANAAKEATNSASAIQDAADRIGISAEAVQRLQFAAEQGGASIDAVAIAITRMSSNLTDGSKGTIGALTSMNLRLEDLRQMSPDQAFSAIADAIAKVPDPLRQAALAQDLFGKGGAVLLPAIKAGFTEIGNQAPVMSNAVVAAGDATGDKLAQMQQQIATLKAEALIPLLSTFTSMPQSLQVATAGLLEMAPALTNIGIAIMAAGGPTAAIGALKTALMGMSALLTMPAGAIALAVVGLVALFMKWDEISAIVKRVYEAVKSWLVDKFTAIVEGVRQKIDAVTGFFKNMYDAVVGHSIVPDMVNGVLGEFSRMNAGMTTDTQKGTLSIAGLFQGLQDKATSIISGLFGGGNAKGGLLHSIIGGGMEALFGPGSGLIASLATKGMQKLGEVVRSGLKKVGGYFKDLFGGPSAQELGGREIAREFENTVNEMYHLVQDRVEPAHEQWQRNNILLREAYIKLGMDGPAAIAKTSEMLTRLHQAEKQGAAATRLVMEEIIATLEQGLRPAADTVFGDMRQEIAATTVAGLVLHRELAKPIETQWVVRQVVHTVEQARESERQWASSAGNDQLRAAIDSFIRNNANDWHRIPSALGISPSKLHELGIPGFATGTGGRVLDFGRGTLVALHGRERVQTEAEVHGDDRVAQLEQRFERLLIDLPRAITIAQRDALVLAGAA